MKAFTFLLIFVFLDCFSSGLTADCNQFFQGKPWPIPARVKTQDLVKLCQTDCGSPTQYYATLFNTNDKIPVYSANVVNINRNQTTYHRPGSNFWRRVARALCNHHSLPWAVYDSEIGSQGTMKCEQLQAVDSDYKNNNMKLDRGHLNPNSINSRDYYKQKATFTLTNAAPQYRQFNGIWWRVIECITEQTILDWVPNEDVYIMTGTFGAGTPSHMKSVLIPGYFWKAVCYPGNTHTGADQWGYAIIRPNKDEVQKVSFKDYMTLDDFADEYFPIASPPFGSNCISPRFGKFETLKNIVEWNHYLRKCKAPKN